LKTFKFDKNLTIVMGTVHEGLFTFIIISSVFSGRVRDGHQMKMAGANKPMKGTDFIENGIPDSGLMTARKQQEKNPSLGSKELHS
jgi:hypothetical protein